VIDGPGLRELPGWAKLDPGSAAALARQAVARRFARDQVLFTAGSESRGLFIVLDGEVKVVRGRDGRQCVIHVEGPGGTLGEVPLFAGGGYPATGIATRPTTCAVLTIPGLRAALGERPELAFVLLGRMGNRVRELVQRLDRVTLLDVRARLASYLLERSEDGKAPLGRSQAALAEELGTVREVVVRALRGLYRTGAIEPSGRGRVAIRDSALLRRLAEP
jgi:CRP/FNR family transcriptional regulator